MLSVAPQFKLPCPDYPGPLLKPGLIFAARDGDVSLILKLLAVSLAVADASVFL